MPHFQSVENTDGTTNFIYDYAHYAPDTRFGRSMWRYWRLLPLTFDTPADLVTLGEGGTPLLHSRLYPQHHIYYKDDSRNPTGSHKDRALAVAINHARQSGAQTSVVVSAGSTGIANAALAARAGLRSITLMSSDAPAWRVYPVFALGSAIVRVSSDIDTLIDRIIAICRKRADLYLSSTTRISNPYQAEGSKTIAYEIVDDLGDAPDWLLVPVGGGGTIGAIWRGFLDLRALGQIDRLPKLIGVVPRDYNALEQAFQQGIGTQAGLLGLDYPNSPPTVLTKIAHRHAPDGMEALNAVRDSGGFFLSVSDEEALAAQRRLGVGEGIYVEPSSAVAISALDRLLAQGGISGDETTVVLLCGSGFRETFVTMEHTPLHSIDCDADTLADALDALFAHG